MLQRCYPAVLLLSLACLFSCSDQPDGVKRLPGTGEHPGIDDPQELLGYFTGYLEFAIDSWEDDLGIEVNIVVIDSPDAEILVAAQDIFGQRAIGSESPTGGLLILLNQGSDEARIAVSRNLEGTFTDALVGPIAKAQLAPYMSYDMAGMAVMDTLSALRNNAYAAVRNGSLQLDASFMNDPRNRYLLDKSAGGGGGQTTIPAASANDNFKNKPQTSLLRRYTPGSTPLESVAAYERSLADNVGYPLLDLFNPGTQVMRDMYPYAVHEEVERLVSIRDSRPLTVTIEGDRAVVSSDDPAHAFVPIMLENIDGLWRVDISEMFKALFYDREGNYYLHNSTTPYLFGLEGWGDGKGFDVAPLGLPAGTDLHTALAVARKGESAAARFHYAELLFRNGFAAVESFKHYNAAVQLQPDKMRYRIVAADRFAFVNSKRGTAPHAEWLKQRARTTPGPKVIPDDES
jgi:hypothetical protein